MRRTSLILAVPILASLASPLRADDAEIVAALAERQGDTWTFSVTLRHDDTGWDNYADGWRVVAGDGTVLGVRTLLHPHVDEQPFTRSLSGVAIPETAETVFIEARTNTDGWGATRHAVTLGR